MSDGSDYKFTLVLQITNSSTSTNVKVGKIRWDITPTVKPENIINTSR